MVGFVNDSTLTNPGDPSSMKNIGNSRNSIYNIRVEGLPDGTKLVKCKVPGDWHNKGAS